MSDNWVLDVAKDRIKRLESENGQLKEGVQKIKQMAVDVLMLTEKNSQHQKQLNTLHSLEINKYKEALRVCSPFSRRGLCEFCVLGNWEHTDDCEYVRLTGGAE